MTQTYIDEMFTRLLDEASRATGYSPSIIKGKSKVPMIVRVRWALFRVLRSTGLSLDQIGNLFGMDHSNVLHGIKCGDKLMTTTTRFIELTDTLQKSLICEPEL